MPEQSTARRQVVVTGMGTTNPIGGDVASTWSAALAGTSGVATLDNDWTETYGTTVTFAGTVKVDPLEVLPRPEARRLDPSGQLAVVAADEAWVDAGEPDVEGERLGVVVATGIGGIHTLLNAWDTVREKGARRVLPLTVPMLMANSPAASISVKRGARAGAHAPVSACASGAEAVAYGVDMIRKGIADVVIAGGTESAIHPVTMASFGKMQALSTRNDDPQAASRPYDVDRDGFVMGEGAGIVVLESAEHAAARGATVHAEVLGVGMTADAFDVAPPDPSGQGQERAMRIALEDSGLAASDVVHVNAHATSTPVGDTIEAEAVRRLFGEQVTVSGTKSMTGHLLGGAGALETIFAVLAVKERTAPPTINIENLDPAVNVDVVRDTPRDLPGTGRLAALNNAFGFGGHNAALLVGSV
ncbi:beta-ketoacyl-[acyl-carrier-protein] synthase family protein [Georgenia sp. Z1491]|uniref:beta-ketoacyl-[acyl-carrier-protein] synthase family protein n=1 Tax=Georgenia sp. Z1491 TaxID=3416707 RepID=UPI003CFB3C93